MPTQQPSPSPLSSPRLTEWISYDDSDGTTWLFDVSFLTSRWTCVFGCGCQGVLTEPSPELDQGCCSYGAHFADAEDRRSVKRATKRLRPDQWQHMAESVAAGGPIARDDDGAWTTILVDDACVFLNRPGFEGGTGCALHRAALDHGERPLDWKPDVCWQLPLRLVPTIDENGHVTNTLRHWARRDWGEGGAEFAWWCTEGTDAFVGDAAVYVTLADEIIEMVGREPYEWLVDQLKDRRSRPGSSSRSKAALASQPVAAPGRRRGSA